MGAGHLFIQDGDDDDNDEEASAAASLYGRSAPREFLLSCFVVRVQAVSARAPPIYEPAPHRRLGALCSVISRRGERGPFVHRTHEHARASGVAVRACLSRVSLSGLTCVYRMYSRIARY